RASLARRTLEGNVLEDDRSLAEMPERLPFWGVNRKAADVNAGTEDRTIQWSSHASHDEAGRGGDHFRNGLDSRLLPKIHRHGWVRHLRAIGVGDVGGGHSLVTPVLRQLEAGREDLIGAHRRVVATAGNAVGRGIDKNGSRSG